MFLHTSGPNLFPCRSITLSSRRRLSFSLTHGPREDTWNRCVTVISLLMIVGGLKRAGDKPYGKILNIFTPVNRVRPNLPFTAESNNVPALFHTLPTLFSKLHGGNTSRRTLHIPHFNNLYVQAFYNSTYFIHRGSGNLFSRRHRVGRANHF